MLLRIPRALSYQLYLRRGGGYGGVVQAAETVRKNI